MNCKNLIELKEKIKRDLINHYDLVKSQIDIDIQENFIKPDSNLADNLIYELVELNKELIDKVDSNSDQSMNEINNYFNSLNNLYSNIEDLNSFKLLNKSIDESSIKMTALNKYCLYISKANLNSIFSNGKIRHGILISLNWYPSENEVNYTKYF